MTKCNVMYQIIYGIDIPLESDVEISDCKTELLRKTSLFHVTETETDEPETYKAHRKYVGLLDAMQTEKFLDEIGAFSTCETMGSLTLDFGWLPAVSFQTESAHFGFWDCCYISPVALDIVPGNFDPENNTQDALILKNEIYPKTDKLLDNLRDILDFEPDDEYDGEAAKCLVNEVTFDLDQMHLEF